MTASPNLPVPIPSPLETPPMTTGNIQQDMPLLINWFWRAYQVISQSVSYINSQITNPAFSVANLPDPASTTLAQAQTTANNAYNLANTANVEATNNTASIAALHISTINSEISALQTLWSDLLSGTFTMSDATVAEITTFGTPQADTAYRVIVQAVSSTGSPASGAFTVVSKVYTTTDFTVTMLSAPGGGNSVTYEWQLIRNT